MDVATRKFYSFTKEDNRRLQVLQNKLLRIKSGLGMETSTETLVKKCEELSVQQLTAYHTLMTVFKAVRLGKPSYLASKFELRRPDGNAIFPHRQSGNISIRADLTLSRGGMVYRGAKLWNMLDAELRNELLIGTFKRKVKKWITEHIPVKPP